MSRRAIVRMVAAVTVTAGTACYQDDATPASPAGLRPHITVRLTDAPFPYDSLSSVTIYVERIEASAVQDTSSTGQWVLITEPRRAFDLLALQQGTTAILGAGELPAGQYHAVRMTIDTSQSSIRWNDAAQHEAQVNWHGWSAIYAFVEYPVNVPTQGADIVIDFDVGQSFLFDYYGTSEFDFTPRLRAINAAGAGAIAGTVTTNAGGTSSAVPNVQVAVYVPSPTQPDSIGYLEATGRSDAAGHYRVAFLPPGKYIVTFREPFMPWLEPVVVPNAQVTAGDTSALSVVLPNAGAGGAYVRVSGPTSVGVGGVITLRAAVGDASGNPVANPAVTWTTRDPTIVDVSSTSTDTASVLGRQAGFATITASSGGLSDAITIQVVGSPGAPVAVVTVQPASASLQVGDSVYFTAELRDSTGTPLSGRPVSWFSTDTSVFVIQFQGGTNPIAIVRPVGLGNAILRATSEGKTGQAAITVH